MCVASIELGLISVKWQTLLVDCVALVMAYFVRLSVSLLNSVLFD